MSERSGPILAIDTSMTRAYVVLADAAGAIVEADAWVAGHRHGEELLPRVDAMLARHGVRAAGLGGVVVGLGPGAFTGLRVGIATAKGMATGLGIPIAGVSSAAILTRAAVSAGVAGTASGVAVLLPAGPSERTLVTGAGAIRLAAGMDSDLGPGTTLVAVDLAGRASDDALARGAAALERFAEQLAGAGAARLAAGGDDVARIVPEYVTPPRGVPAITGEVAWSRTRG
jgi:bifunctional N6-L-threonylcarbamoyladenine synthase / protein kinase Bud32